MIFSKLFSQQTSLQVYTDGAIGAEGEASGLAAVARDHAGQILWTWKQRAGPMTCNQAEYEAVILALENLTRHGVRRIHVYCDSKVVVDQMCGLARVRSANLRRLHFRLRALTGEFEQVSFHHISRLHNRLADALANEALTGYLPHRQGVLHE